MSHGEPGLAWPEEEPGDGPAVLRAFRPDDVAMARDMATDPSVPPIGTLPAYADEVQALAWIDRQHERFTDGRGFSFAIADATSGEAAGVIGLTLREHGRASVGYTVAPRARGGRLATHALRALVEFAWTLPDLFRLEAYVEPANTASIATAEAAGFEREGLLRSCLPLGGRRRDMALYARVRGSSTSAQ